MILLLDTHTFLWFVMNDPRLSARAKSLIEDPGNQRLLSVASAWEMAIKVSLNKMTLTEPLHPFLLTQLTQNQTSLLPITLEHLQIVSSLPFHHRDPFDRLIIAQSLVDNLSLLSADASFDAYGVARLW
jgi:PIN domain nuclease of toxin-antitoxin system